MNITDLQKVLASAGLYKQKIDGIAGRGTMAAADAYLEKRLSPEQFESWSDSRRLIAVEQLHYAAEKIPVGAIDGLVGPQTRYARELYQAKRRGEMSAVTGWRDEQMAATPTKPSEATKWPLQTAVSSYFGAQNSSQVLLEMPFPLRLAWEPSTIVNRVSCHRKVHDALRAIWTQTLDHYGIDGVRKLRLDMFGGCLNQRPMRGGTKPSMHSWGIAWDIDPDRNQYKWGRDLATLDAADYEPFWRIVEGQGAVSLGRLKNFDWMHFQFARLS